MNIIHLQKKKVDVYFYIEKKFNSREQETEHEIYFLRSVPAAVYPSGGREPAHYILCFHYF